jgi:hypothetical protein
MGAGGVSPVSGKEASGEGRIKGDGVGRCTTKPPLPRLAAVEAAEQVQNFRVADGVLTDVGEGGCRRGGESRDGLGEMVGGGGGGSTRRRRNFPWKRGKNSCGRKKIATGRR